MVNKTRLPLVLADFRPVVVCPQVPQDQLLDYMASLMAAVQCVKRGVHSNGESERIHAEVRRRVYRYGVSSHDIRQRQCSLLRSPADVPAPGAPLKRPPKLFENLEEQPSGALLNERMAFYDSLVTRFLQIRYAHANGSPPDDIVHVTCAGYLSPSPVQKMVSKLGWHDTVVTHCYHMGCYGAFPAVRMVAGFLAASHVSVARPKSQVDILHTEALSIHFDVAAVTPGNVVNMTLFGDGFISYSAFTEPEARKRGLRGLKILAYQDKIIPGSTQKMTWTPGPCQFDMSLSKDVPLHIRDAVSPFVESLCAQVGLDFKTHKQDIIFGVHPGGPKILDVIRRRLELEPEQLELSRQVLYDNGNMSSATVPHIWARIVENDAISAGTKILSMGFGPGLTATGLLLEKV
ncbi:MAG: 3-oxoacyl-[acyl-carrier-protein] synthase III C-terminal domain-containing protein [Acidobacteriota bacterium]